MKKTKISKQTPQLKTNQTKNKQKNHPKPPMLHPAAVNQELSAREFGPFQLREGRRDSAPACLHSPLSADSGEVLHRHTLAPKEQN